jgi:hypothetical protein
MSIERSTAGTGIGAEHAPTPGATQAEAIDATGVSPAMRIQILSTEHWSLLASRSLAWNEVFSRSGMFLSTLSGAIVALALVGQASAFGDAFRLFGLVILPPVLFVGIGTVLRLGMANYHDALCVVGMNRIRAAYLELAPDLRRYFVTGTYDDEASVAQTMGLEPNVPMALQMVASSPMLITVLNSLLFAAIWALALFQLGAGLVVALVVGAAAFLAAIVAHSWYAGRGIARARRSLRPMFPPPPGL